MSFFDTSLVTHNVLVETHPAYSESTTEMAPGV